MWPQHPLPFLNPLMTRLRRSKLTVLYFFRLVLDTTNSVRTCIQLQRAVTLLVVSRAKKTHVPLQLDFSFWSISLTNIRSGKFTVTKQSVSLRFIGHGEPTVMEILPTIHGIFRRRFHIHNRLIWIDLYNSDWTNLHLLYLILRNELCRLDRRHLVL